MKAQFIAIGDELLSGRTQDTNGNWLASFLFSHGINLEKMIIVADDQKEILTQLNRSWQESDLIFISGGLGPTKDDITKTAIAKFFKKKIFLNDEADQIARENYANLTIPYDPQNSGYNMLPKDFIPLKNPCGCAPGLFYIEKGKALASAPGVPREFTQMIEEEIWPAIESGLTLNSTPSIQVTIRTYGIAEESIFFKEAPALWNDLEEFGKVSSLPGNFAVDIIVKLNDPGRKEELISMIQQSPIASYIWQIGELPLAEYIIQEANKKNLTIGFAESCTGGLVASTITDIAGSSSVFMGSVISYSNEAKSELLGVPVDLITTHGAVSTEVARAMAKGARKKLKCDIAISLTGIAGPSGGSKEKPVGTVAIGLSTHNQSESSFHHFKGDRIKLKARFARTALFKILELIRL